MTRLRTQPLLVSKKRTTYISLRTTGVQATRKQSELNCIWRLLVARKKTADIIMPAVLKCTPQFQTNLDRRHRGLARWLQFKFSLRLCTKLYDYIIAPDQTGLVHPNSCPFELAMDRSVNSPWHSVIFQFQAASFESANAADQ